MAALASPCEGRPTPSIRLESPTDWNIMRSALLVVGVLAGVGLAADPNTPHIHQGSLEPFKAGPPPTLTASEKASLAAGKTVTKTVKLPGLGARAMAVFDVPAPPEVVWDCINDIKQYPKMVSGVTAVQIYDGPKSIGGGGTLTKAQYTLSFVGYKVSYYVELKYEPRLNSMTFHLDYSRNSDLDDTVGHWHVVAIDGPDGAVHSRISYSAALTLRMWLPKAVVDMLFATTLGQATSWVAPEAKKRLAAAGGAGGSAVVAAKKTGKKVCKWSLKGRRCKTVETPPPPPPPPSSLRAAMDTIVNFIALVAAGGAFLSMLGA